MRSARYPNTPTRPPARKTAKTIFRNFFWLRFGIDNVTGSPVNPSVLDTIRQKDPLFFLLAGNLQVNNGANQPTTTAEYLAAYRAIFQSSRQFDFWKAQP